eukprot:gene16288-biopygen13573
MFIQEMIKDDNPVFRVWEPERNIVPDMFPLKCLPPGVSTGEAQSEVDASSGFSVSHLVECLHVAAARTHAFACEAQLHLCGVLNDASDLVDIVHGAVVDPQQLHPY